MFEVFIFVNGIGIIIFFFQVQVARGCIVDIVVLVVLVMEV